MQLEEIYALFKSSNGVCIDSRQLRVGQLFIALNGPNFNANKFAIDAIQKGAAAAIVDEPPVEENDKIIVVPDALECLQKLANLHRRKMRATVIVVGGSNGKTTCKELISRVLSTKFRTFSTPGNFNNHIGVPLSLLQIRVRHQMAVIEIGANHAGEHTELCKIVEPDFGLVTNNGKDHLEGFGSIEGVIRANAEILIYLKENDKKVFFNTNDTSFDEYDHGLNKITYGTKNGGFVKLNVLQSVPTATIEVSLNGANWYKIYSKLFGAFQRDNVGLAACVGHYFGLNSDDIRKGVENYYPDNMRGQVMSWRRNEVILDAYNANPSSVLAILEGFAAYAQSPKGVILGDMLELGDASVQEHKLIQEYLLSCSFEWVLFVGKEFERVENEKCYYVNSSLEAKDWLIAEDITGHYLLIKGSRGLKMEDIVNDN